MLKFRPLNDDDFPLIEKWLRTEHVKKWFEIPSLGISIEDWMSEIRAYKSNFKWITYIIVLYQSNPIGLCLFYKCEDSIDEDFGTLELEGSYGIDYLIGECDFLGKGLGKELVGQLILEIFTQTDAKRITADIDKRNMASKRVLISNGFTLLDAEKGRYVINRKFS